MKDREIDTKIDYLYSFRLLGQACFGVLVGALIAMLVAGWTLKIGGRLTQIPDDLLAWNLHNIWPKPREKGFYVLTLIFGILGAYITTARLWRTPAIFVWSLLLLSLPLVNSLAGHIIQQGDYFLRLYTTISGVLFLLFFLSYFNKKIIPITKPSPYPNFQWKMYIGLLFLITLILIPSSFTAVAAHIGIEFHVASTIIAPALYFLGSHLLPGIDYYTQYSIGQPWLFSFFLGHSAAEAMINYVIFAILITWIFFAQFLYLMHWLYKSWLPAAIVTLLFLVMLFHGDRHFFDPSSSVLRYPLLGISAGLLAYWIKIPKSFFRTIALASILALSLFFNTETGIITALAVASSAFVQNKSVATILISLLQLAVFSALLLLAMVFMVFGARAFHFDFLYYISLPLFYFGQYGFGGTPIVWKFRELNWFYNLVSPAVVIGTLALIMRTKKYEQDSARLAVLTFFAIVGLLMMAKFINMSLIGLWHMNALGFLVVFVWWGNALSKNCDHLVFKKIVWIFVIASAVYLAGFSTDARNSEMSLGLRSWIYYPSLGKFIFSHAPFGKFLIGKTEERCHTFDCVPYQPAPKDIKLIQEKTKPGEQVAIIDLYDWAYLVNAHRPPLMLFLPSTTIFTKRQLTESLNRLKSTPYLFLPKGPDKIFNFGHDDLKDNLQTTFEQEYQYDGEGERLIAWKRKS